ncbi:MAG: ABC transporter ATP-binding protein [Desulfobacteraceae bacterium]|jgi:branched-chain amino acid transport system ATP-binding protein
MPTWEKGGDELNLLEVKDIRVLYDKAIALNGLSIDLSEKELVGVVGPNGAGKTTLLRAISAVVPIEGEIFFNGERIDRCKPHEIIRLGIIHCPERRQLFSEFTVVENLEMGAFLRKDKGQVQKDLEQVYSFFPILEKRRTQVAGTLSGGEQQMMAIGRSLMSKPRLLMMDEPSMGLSPLVKTDLVDSIMDIWKSGMTVLLVEQDASLTLELTQRVYILEHGRIRLEGGSEELRDNKEVKEAYFQLG